MLYLIIRPQEKSMNLKRIIKSIPGVGPAARRIYLTWINPPKPFQGSESYWISRYEAGGNSGDGSYNQLAEFKAEILNTLVSENAISSVIDYGCGDGHQLSLAQYPKYIGFDVSPEAISMCLKRFSNDETKTFKLMEAYGGETAELNLSLDVIYHLVEDNVFVEYMNMLFDSSERFVVIYSSDTNENPEGTVAHIRHRHFTKWITDNMTKWKLIKHIPNKFPFNGDNKSGSRADFYIYLKS
jgi:SAM-dependent methyltransferase